MLLKHFSPRHLLEVQSSISSTLVEGFEVVEKIWNSPSYLFKDTKQFGGNRACDVQLMWPWLVYDFQLDLLKPLVTLVYFTKAARCLPVVELSFSERLELQNEMKLLKKVMESCLHSDTMNSLSA